MNLLAARVTLRPRSLSDVLDLAVPFCAQSWRVMARLSAALLLPLAAGCLYLRWGRGWDWDDVWLLAIVASDLVEGVFAVAAGELLFHPPREVRVRSLLRTFRRRAGAYLVAYVVGRAALAISLLTVAGLPFVAPRFLFVRETVFLEGGSPMACLGRSVRLVRREVMPCLLMALALLLAPALFVLGGEMLGQAVLRFTLQMGTPVGDLFADGGSAFAVVGLFLAVPVTAMARFLKYIDLRTRKEGWDIQLRFMATAAAAAGTTTGGAGVASGAPREAAS